MKWDKKGRNCLSGFPAESLFEYVNLVFIRVDACTKSRLLAVSVFGEGMMKIGAEDV